MTEEEERALYLWERCLEISHEKRGDKAAHSLLYREAHAALMTRLTEVRDSGGDSFSQQRVILTQLSSIELWALDELQMELPGSYF